MSAQSSLSIAMIDVGSILMRADNPRTHSNEQVAQIARSIREFGFVNPVLLDQSMTMVAGHGRLAAALRIGMKEVPAIVLSDLTDEQCRALVVADNQIAMNSGWDSAMLQSQIREIIDAAEVNIETLGFAPHELAGILDGASVIDEMKDSMSSGSSDDAMARIRVTVDRENETDARDVIDRALTAAGLTFAIR